MTYNDKLTEPDLSSQTVDRYHLLRRIGVGGMGAVYEAEHVKLRKRFAVKLLRSELARDEVSRKRFLREARAASAISHPNIVAISDFGETSEGHVFSVMELLVGRDLHALLEQESVLSWPRTRALLMQVTSALDAAHQRDIIHRDIKPSNVFIITPTGSSDLDFVKVLDFGIAKLSGNVGEATANLTSTDEIFGTVAYMAPEMATGTSNDPRSDVYAVGVMMYRMLTGELPFARGNAFQILSQHISTPVPRPREKQPSITPAVEAIILRAMAKNPDERFSSMGDLHRVLEHGAIEGSAIDGAEDLGGPPGTVQVGLLEQAPLIAAGPRDVDKTTPLPKRRAPQSIDATEVIGPVRDGGRSGTDGDAARPHGAPPSSNTSSITVAVSRHSGGTEKRTYVSSSPQAERLDEPPAEEGSRRSLLLPLVVGAAIVSAAAAYWVLGPGGAGGADGRDGQEGVADSRQVADGAARAVPVDEDDAPSSSSDAVGIAAEGSSSSASATSSPEPMSTTGSAVGGDREGGDMEQGLPTAEEAEPEPVEASEEAEPEQPRRTKAKPKPRAKPKAKPKTDREVVNALKAKISSKCAGQSGGQVKVEGMISSAGKVESLLVTPPGGLGDCQAIVRRAKFDPQGGVRPMPRFSVSLSGK